MDKREELLEEIRVTVTLGKWSCYPSNIREEGTEKSQISVLNLRSVDLHAVQEKTIIQSLEIWRNVQGPGRMENSTECDPEHTVAYHKQEE